MAPPEAALLFSGGNMTSIDSARTRAFGSRRARVRAAVAFVASAAIALTAVVGLSAPAAADEPVSTGATVTKTIRNAQATYLVGQDVTYDIQVQCSSLTVVCGPTTLTDQLDPNLKLIGITAPAGAGVPPLTVPTAQQVTDANNLLTIGIGNATTPFADGTTLTFTVVAKIISWPAATNGLIPNQAQVTALGTTRPSQVVTVPVTKPVKDWTLDKARYNNTTGAVPGESTTYQISVSTPKTSGWFDVSNVTIVDTLPADTDFISASLGGVYDSITHTVTWSVPFISGSVGFSPTVTIVYPVDTFGAAPLKTTATNHATATVTYPDGEQESLEDSVDEVFSSVVVNSDVSIYKSGPALAGPGENVQWTLNGLNSGTRTVSQLTVIDTLPVATLENLRLVLAGGSPAIATTFDFFDGTTWSGAVLHTPGAAELPIPAGTTAVRAVALNVAPGAGIRFSVAATVPADADKDIDLVNCATAQTSDSRIREMCVTTDVTDPKVVLLPTKWRGPDAGSVVPGQEFDWPIGFRMDSSTLIHTATLVDVLPAELEYVGVSDCFGATPATGYVYYNLQGAADCDHVNTVDVPTVTPVVTALPDGTTRVALPNQPMPEIAPYAQRDLVYGTAVRVRVKAGTAIGEVTNTLQVFTDEAQSTCSTNNTRPVDPWKAVASTDAADADADGDTTESGCTTTDVAIVAESVAIDATKWDKGMLENVAETTGLADEECPNWDGFTRFPCVAQTIPGGAIDYRMKLTNLGNVALTDYVVYDVLPHVGDKGVTEFLSEGQRGTQWTPELTGPVVVDAALTTAANAAPVVEYSLSSNPCRPELATGSEDANWQGTDCVDEWLTEAEVTDWTSVKSFRMTAFSPDSDDKWAPGADIVLAFPMKAPIDAEQSVKDPLDLSVAWNSIGQRVHRTTSEGDGSIIRLQANAPRKVGVIIPFTLPELVSVGDYTWWDHDRDGQQDANEPVAAGIPVVLYAADGVTKLDETITDENGFYSFINLTPSTAYVIEFGKPAGDAVSFTGQNQGADVSDSDADRATGRVLFTSPADGQNSAVTPDDPTIDAGYVQFNLVLEKKLESKAPFSRGQEVEYTLTVHNEGPSAALDSWTVTDLLPAGLEFVSMTGDAEWFTISGETATALQGLKADEEAPSLTVTARISESAVTGLSLKNVAYVTPSPADVTETNPLGPVPTTDTDTPTTPTDNDDEQKLTVTEKSTPTPTPTEEPTPTPTPTPTEEPTPTPTPTEEPTPEPTPTPTEEPTPEPTATPTPTVPPVDVDPTQSPTPTPTSSAPVITAPTPTPALPTGSLPNTGSAPPLALGVLALAVLITGGVLVIIARRRTPEETTR